MTGDSSRSRRVKSGLGGHEEGVRGVDDGVEKASFSLRKCGRMVMFVCATFSHFDVTGNEIGSENRNSKN